MTDMVVLSLEAWDSIWRRNQHLVAGLLTADPTLRVLFVEPAADPLHTVRQKARPRKGKGLRRGPRLEGVDSAALWLLQPTKALPRRFDPHVDDRMARGTRRAANRLGFTNPVLWINDPGGATLLSATRWPALYDITDDWLVADRTPAEHERLVRDEALLLEHADEVVVCSPTLQASKGAGRIVTLIPNAVDLDGYQTPSLCPVDLPRGPVALYLGTVHTDRIDLDVCARTAQYLKGTGHLVLVGPVLLTARDHEHLVAAGVLLLGPKDRRDVPAYLMHADVLVVPHVVTPFTDSLDPIKLYEYRAAGRPVVSTPVAGFRDSDDARVTIAARDDFADAVGAALGRGSGDHLRLKSVGFTDGSPVPTWDDRVTQMRAVLDRLPPHSPSVAIAHDYLTQRGGAERVVLAMHRAFPGATIYTTLYDPDGTYPEFKAARIVTSALNRIGPLRRNHRLALPVLAIVSSRMRIKEDVVVVSSSGWAHGFSARGKKLVYCHAPARWLYQTDAYLGGPASSSLKGQLVLVLRPWLRRWDRRAAASADRYLANSRVVRERIQVAYGIDATVLPAPHSIDAAAERESVDLIADWADPPGFHLIVSRLLPYKNVEQAVAAFRGLDERLVIVGDGPLRQSLAASLPVNVRMLSGLSDPQMRWIYGHCCALIAPSLEDYGLTPLEAAAFGKPTLALRAGGYLDTVAEDTTGSFFDEPSPAAIRSAVLANRTQSWSATVIRESAEQFAESRFRDELLRLVAEAADRR